MVRHAQSQPTTSWPLAKLRFASAKSIPDMSLALLFFQTVTPSPTPASAPEKLPAWLTLIYLSGLAVIILLLLVSLLRMWLTRSVSTPTAHANLPKDILKKLG